MLGQQHPVPGADGFIASVARTTISSLLGGRGPGSHRLPLAVSLSLAGTMSLGLWCLIALAAWLLVT